MSDNDDMINLYSKRILAAAANIPFTAPLTDFDGTAMRRSPLCGSNLRVWVKLEDGRISAFGQDVKACALGQAAASIFASAVVGLSIDEITKGRDQMFAMLTQDGDVPEAPFDALEVLLPARAYKNRHASIMLCFEATLDAIQDADAKKRAPKGA
jgi:NifU-like protein involved in Fe-S cluster formation